jgi:hypothetical protein
MTFAAADDDEHQTGTNETSTELLPPCGIFAEADDDGKSRDG